MTQTIKKRTSTPLPVTEPEVEQSTADKIGDWLAENGTMLALVTALGFLIFMAVVWLLNSRQSQQEAQWNQLQQSIAGVGLTGKSDGLLDVADEFPDGKAGLWALQLAGDYDLQNGLATISQDRQKGIELIKKARESLQRIVDAPDSQKTTMLQRRSTFSLAYALESLGEFDKANKYYQQLVDAAPDSAFAPAAKRGAERTSNPAFVALYDKFKNFEEELGDAPGPLVPDQPDISFPEIPDISDDIESGDDDNAAGDEMDDAEEADTPESAESNDFDTSNPSTDPMSDEAATDEATETDSDTETDGDSDEENESNTDDEPQTGK